MTSDHSAASSDVFVELLDPAYGRPIKAWNFSDRTQITIGRGDEQDIEVSDAYVSRSHAELMLRDGTWVLISRGRNGVLVGDRPITEEVLKSGAKFRLGASGPCLRFSTAVAKSESMQTICFDTVRAPVFQVDQAKVQHEVGAIADGDYFQRLQQQARSLREKREAN